MKRETPPRRRLETAALVVGYAMSRLDRRFLAELGFRTWNQAFAACGRALRVPANSVKGLRDEFDPLHANPRRGWADREMVPNRVRVAGELVQVSDDAVLELARRLLARDERETRAILDELQEESSLAGAEARRLLTGRQAEEFVLEHADDLLGVPRRRVLDRREDLLGFDFEVQATPAFVVEVKGLRGLAGSLLFTDREWREARRRRARYWLVTVGNLATAPHGVVLRDPSATLNATCAFERAVRPTWRATVRLAGASLGHVAEEPGSYGG